MRSNMIQRRIAKEKNTYPEPRLDTNLELPRDAKNVSLKPSKAPVAPVNEVEEVNEVVDAEDGLEVNETVDVDTSEDKEEGFESNEAEGTEEKTAALPEKKMNSIAEFVKWVKSHVGELKTKANKNPALLRKEIQSQPFGADSSVDTSQLASAVSLFVEQYGKPNTSMNESKFVGTLEKLKKASKKIAADCSYQGKTVVFCSSHDISSEEVMEMISSLGSFKEDEGVIGEGDASELTFFVPEGVTDEDLELLRQCAYDSLVEGTEDEEFDTEVCGIVGDVVCSTDKLALFIPAPTEGEEQHLGAAEELFDEEGNKVTLVDNKKPKENTTKSETGFYSKASQAVKRAAEGGAEEEEETEEQTTIDTAVVQLLETAKAEWAALGDPVNPATWPKEIERAILALNDDLLRVIDSTEKKLAEGEFYSKNVDEGVEGGNSGMMGDLNVAPTEATPAPEGELPVEEPSKVSALKQAEENTFDEDNELPDWVEEKLLQEDTGADEDLKKDLKNTGVMGSLEDKECVKCNGKCSCDTKTASKTAAEATVTDVRRALKHTQTLKDQIADKFFEFKKNVQPANDSAIVKNLGENLVRIKGELEEVEKTLGKQLAQLEAAEELEKDQKKSEKKASDKKCYYCKGPLTRDPNGLGGGPGDICVECLEKQKSEKKSSRVVKAAPWAGTQKDEPESIPELFKKKEETEEEEETEKISQLLLASLSLADEEE